jgi:hypothetical protein
MLERGTHTRSTDQKYILGAGLVAAIAIVVGAFFWTTYDRQLARNDPRAGTTTETSPKNPGYAPTRPEGAKGD